MFHHAQILVNIILSNLVTNAKKYGGTTVLPILSVVVQGDSVEMRLWNEPSATHASFIGTTIEQLRAQRRGGAWLSDHVGLGTALDCAECVG